LLNLFEVLYVVQSNTCNIYGGEHVAHVTANLLWCTVRNGGGM